MIMSIMSIMRGPATRSRPPALTVFAAIRWIGLFAQCSRRQRARRFLALILPLGRR